MSDKPIDKTALSYWFPKLAAAGLPVPQTVLLDMPVKAQECIWAGYDGKDGDAEQTAAFVSFLRDICRAACSFGFPVFLRTDHTSNKHNWSRTCFLDSDDLETIATHVHAIVEFSDAADIIGLPWSRWAVREFLPVIPLTTCPNYGDMPLCREFRFFVDHGKVKCWHPYWPEKAIEQGGVSLDAFEIWRLSAQPDAAIGALAQRVASVIDGAWSVDILETKRGWYVTDMAEAHKSFHWVGCEKLAT